MIEEDRDWGGFTVHCDECSYLEEFDEETWGEMISAIKAEGWRISKSDEGEWRHSCPNCVAATH